MTTKRSKKSPNRITLTDARVKAIKKPGYAWDTGLSASLAQQGCGFAVRCYEKDKRLSAVIRYPVNGKPKIKVLGPVDRARPEIITWRNKAERALTDYLENDVDPSTGYTPQESKQRESGTVAAMIDLYVADLRKKGRAPEYIEKTKRECERFVPLWMQAMPAIDLTTDMLDELHTQVSDRKVIDAESGERRGGKTTANRLRSALHRAFKVAQMKGVWNLRSVPNPVEFVTKNKERKRKGRLQLEHLKPLWESIEAEESVYMQSLFKLYLLSGCRKAELLGLKWENIDFRRQTMAVANKGADEDELVTLPISPLMVTLLKDCPKVAGNPYVFVGKIEGKPLVNIDSARLRIFKRAGLTELNGETATTHHLRHTFASMLLDAGKSKEKIGLAMKHANSQSTEVYLHGNAELARDVVDAQAAAVERAVVGADVVSIR